MMRWRPRLMATLVVFFSIIMLGTTPKSNGVPENNETIRRPGSTLQDRG